MRVAITEQGKAYAVPPAYPDDVTPKWAYDMSPGPAAIWACEYRPPLNGVEKVARVVEVPADLTHWDFKSNAPCKIIGSTKIVEDERPSIRPIIGHPLNVSQHNPPPRSYKPKPPPAPPPGSENRSQHALRDMGCIQPTDWVAAPWYQWMKDALSAILVLFAYAIVLTVSVKLDDWPLWVSIAILTVIVVGLIGLGSLIGRLRGGADIDP